MTAWFDEEFDVHDPVEVHWSSSTILAIFFAASLVSAVFFGLGYSFGGAGSGNHSFTFNTAPASTSAAEPTPLARSNQPSPIAKVADSTHLQAAIAAPAASPVASRSTAPVPHAVTPAAEKKSLPPAAVRPEMTPAAEKSSAHIMVQVGAIGNRRDAERLMAELRKKGFHAGIYPAKHDKFLHVQIGPFKDVAQAQTKRHQVMARGFHAILKSS